VWTIQPEKGLDIKGKITSETDKPIAKGTITLIPPNRGTLLTGKSDNKGFFQFSNLVFSDSAHLVLSAVNSKGDNHTRITYFNNDHPSPVIVDHPPALKMTEDSGMQPYIEKAGKFHEEMVFEYPGRFKMLKPVTVRAVKHDNQYRTQSFAGAGHADQVMHADEIGKIGGSLTTSLNGRLRGVNFSINGIAYLPTSMGHPMLLVLDGTEIKMDPNTFSLNDIPTSTVETVEVLKYASSSIYGMQGVNGVLVITTKDGSDRENEIVAVGVLPITPVGFYKARTFYSPKYEHSDGNTTEPELRSTIYWNPDIKTGPVGHASVNYFNANSAGTYKVIVEGIDQNGNLGRVVYRYRVE
jgi:TonB-dependent SusC/RagA subfamily outer membrane receptor